METIAENRGRELEKAKEQKHQLASINKRLESSGGGAVAAMDFDALQGSEVPPKIRALIEDAKGLKVRAKKFKDQCAAHERTITSQQSQISKLTDKIAALETAVKKFEKDPETVLAELKNAAAAAEKVAAAEEKAKEMENRLSVVTRSKEVELKKFRIAASGLMKEREAVEAEVESMRAALEEKDKEARAAAIRIRQLKEKTRPKPRPVPVPLEGTVDSTFLTSMDSLPSMGGSLTQPLPPLHAAEDRALEPAVRLVINVPEVVLRIDVRPPEQTHVMLCLVEGDDAPESSARSGLDARELAELEEAAAKIQGVARRRREESESSTAGNGEAAAEEEAEAAAAAGEGEEGEGDQAAAEPEPVSEADKAAEPAKPKKETSKNGGKKPIKHK